MKNFGKIVDPKDMVTKEYVDKFLPLSGGHVTGSVTFGDSITVDEATIGDFVVNGNASFTNNIQANKINGVTVGNNPKFTDTLATATTTGSGNAITAVSATNGALTFTKGSTFLTSHQDISGKADKSATVSTVAYDSTNKKITKTINGTTTDVVTVATLKTDLGSMPASDVYSWAKASSKPTYTASEVGALPNNTTYVSTITTAAGTHSTISNKSGAVSFNVPTKTSHLTNDSGFITNAGVTGVKGSAESSYRTGNVNLTASNVGAVAAGQPLFTTNPFMPYDHGSRSLYISKIDNAFYAADKRFNISLVNNGTSASPHPLFDGDYESGVDVGADKTATVTFDFSESSEGKFPGYPYGYIYVSFYYVNAPKTITGRVYNTYASQGEGWHDLTFTRVLSSAQSENVYAARQAYYGLQTLEITVTGDGSNASGYTRITQIEMWLDRPAPQRTPFVSKYSPETLYYDLTAPKFIGALQGNADTATTAGTITSTLPVSKGGTGATSAVGAANNILSGLPDWSADPTDTTKLIRKDTGGTASFGQVTFSTVWNYIKGKISSVLGLTATNYGGKAATAGTADTATNATKVNNHTVNADVPSNAVFTDTTYESKAAASGGTAVSLVTTGEKYNWNNKQSALVSGTNIKTINNQSILGSGNINISGSGSDPAALCATAIEGEGDYSWGLPYMEDEHGNSGELITTNALIINGGDIPTVTTVLTPNLSASTGTKVSAEMRKYGNVVQLTLTFKNTSSVASGSNVFAGTLNTYKPSQLINGVCYYSNHALVMSINTAGSIVIRNAGNTAVTCSENTTIGATWII